MLEKLKYWYFRNYDKIDFFLIGYTLCDLIKTIQYYWLKPNLFSIVWDISFIIIMLYLRNKEAK